MGERSNSKPYMVAASVAHRIARWDHSVETPVADLDSLVLYAETLNRHFRFHRMLSKRSPFAIYYAVGEETAYISPILDMRGEPAWLHAELEKGKPRASGKTASIVRAASLEGQTRYAARITRSASRRRGLRSRLGGRCTPGEEARLQRG
jgi:hypothetical protein